MTSTKTTLRKKVDRRKPHILRSFPFSDPNTGNGKDFPYSVDDDEDATK